jgi:hypothetical protein
LCISAFQSKPRNLRKARRATVGIAQSCVQLVSCTL